MKNKKHSWWFVLIALVFAVTLLIGEVPQDTICEYDGRGNQSSSILKIPECLLRVWISKRTWTWSDSDKINRTKTEYIGDNISLGPNLSTCHSTHFCCPIHPESELPIIDFELPKPSSHIRIRRPAHLASEDYIAKYEKAVAIMKQLPPDHPHNFQRQANQHCIYCTGAYEQENFHIPFNIHRSWLFFPWHRFYLYFHERILGKLIGDDTFALPYWNWDSPDGMMVPDIYLNGSLNHLRRDISHLPPKIADLTFESPSSSIDPEDQIATNLAVMYNQMVSGAKKLELFMGCRLRPGEAGMCDGPGTIENAPHNTVHTWVGSDRCPRREDMGVFYSAARDPIFYAHHSNVDRMWALWKKLNGKKSEISDPQWLDSHFYFYDENVQLVRVKVRDCLDTIMLGYAYEEADLPWLQARPQPSIDPKIGRDMMRLSINQLVEFKNQGPWTLERAIRVRVDRPRKPRSGEEEEVLVVYGIYVKRDMYARFDVYINVVDEAFVSPRSREFAGSFVNVNTGTMVPQDGVVLKSMTKHNVKLGISDILEDMEADQDESIWVTLVPKGGSCINTTVDGIGIEYMK